MEKLNRFFSWLRKQLIALREKCSANFGWFMPAMRKLDGLFEIVDRWVAKFLKCCGSNAGVILSLIAIALLLTAVFEETRWLWTHNVVITNGNSMNGGKPISIWNGEATRSLGLAVGALGGLYALVLTVRRLRVTEANLFNDRLKDALNFLDNESIPIRCAGILLLEQYALTASIASSEKETIAKVLINYVKTRAALPDGTHNFLNINYSEWPNLEESSRPDLEFAISALTKIIPVEARLKEKVELALDNLDLRRLNLENLDLSFFNFYMSNMWLVDLSGSTLNHTRFSYVNLRMANLNSVNCIGTFFENANMEYCRLSGFKSDSKTSFKEANLSSVYALNVSISGSDFQNADFSNASLSGIGKEFLDKVLSEMVFEKGSPPKLRRSSGLLALQIEVGDERAYELIEDKIFMTDGSTLEYTFPNSPWWRIEEEG